MHHERNLEMKFLFFSILFPLLVLSCSNNVEIAIDNPTDTPIIVKIDTMTIEVPGEDVVRIELDKGPHTISFNDEDAVAFDFTQGAYMLNPTMSEYLVVKEFYGKESDYELFESVSGQSQSKIDFMGMELEGDYSVVKDLVNLVTWEVGPREPLPETVKVDSGQKYATVTKLMSSTEFLQHMIEATKDEESQTEQQ